MALLLAAALWVGLAPGALALTPEVKWFGDSFAGYDPASGFRVFGNEGKQGFTEDLAPMSMDGKCGFIDKTGAVAIPFRYEDTGFFREGLAPACKDGKWGFVNKSGAMVIAPEYDGVRLFSEGLAAVCKDGSWGYIDRTGKLVIPIKYEWATLFYEGLALANEKDREILAINKTGGTVHKFGSYGDGSVKDWFWACLEGPVPVQINDDKFGYVNKTTGFVAVSFQYDDANPFYEGLGLVKKNEKYGFIDSLGFTQIPLKYDDALGFSEGRAAVALDGKCGFVDKSGKLVIPAEYDAADNFRDGLAAVRKDGKWGYVDLNGKLVVPTEIECERPGENSGLVTLAWKEGAVGLLLLDSSTDAGIENFTRDRVYTAGQFADVKDGDWFAGDAASAYELGLMNGSGEGFNPDGSLTIAETLALACRIRDIYQGGSGVFQQGNPWYQVYVDYAVENNIIGETEFRDYSVPATRAQFAEILSKALPIYELDGPEGTEVEVDAIPDVDFAQDWSAAVYMLYRAGVLTGGDAKGTFMPDSPISRSAVAAIVSRMADKSLRKTVRLTAQ